MKNIYVLERKEYSAPYEGEDNKYSYFSTRELAENNMLAYVNTTIHKYTNHEYTTYITKASAESITLEVYKSSKPCRMDEYVFTIKEDTLIDEYAPMDEEEPYTEE